MQEYFAQRGLRTRRQMMVFAQYLLSFSRHFSKMLHRIRLQNIWKIILKPELAFRCNCFQKYTVFSRLFDIVAPLLRLAPTWVIFLCYFKQSKAIDMRFHWIRDRSNRNQFSVYWQPGSENRADYITKFHPPSHFQKMRNIFFNVQRDHQINALFSCLVQGCDNVRISRYESLRKTRRR